MGIWHMGSHIDEFGDDSMTQDDKARYIRIAAVTAIMGNGILAVLKIAFGVISGSNALLGDGIDSVSDVLISAVTLVVVRIAARPADKDHPWGHTRAETVAVAVLSFVLFYAGAQLIISSIATLLSGAIQETPDLSGLVAALVSIVGKILLAFSQRHYGRRSGSAMLAANAKNMAGDALISVGVLVGLFLSSATGSGLPDTILAALVGAWVIKTAVGIFLSANLELMDGGAGTGKYQIVFDAVNSVEGAGKPHRTRIRRIGGYWDIDTDIEVDPHITVEEAHNIASQVERAIKAKVENVFDVMIHVEPRGNEDCEEGFGLSENDP
ncbi:MAG: cation diffusion facilitator family transporter [Oscillospiraceae bacterium]|nr:cation diffusion facilitator family transporter [Oscillospiraceae bacterium]